MTGTELAIQHAVDGYYVRVAEPDRADAASPCHGFVPIKNRPPDHSTAPAALMVSLDALAFVRFGLRAADDPRIVNTIKVIDATLRVETPRGPVWHRYQGDGYGEHADGEPFNGTGIGRVWPLLTGERAHYELAAGRADVAEELARAMEALAGESGLLPEQVWDSADIPGREPPHRARIRVSEPTGVGARRVPEVVPVHSRRRGFRSAAADRGAIHRQTRDLASSHLAVQQQGANHAGRQNPAHRNTRRGVGALERGRLAHRPRYRDARHDLGVHVADLDTPDLHAGDRVDFTFYWPNEARWEGVLDSSSALNKT